MATDSFLIDETSGVSHQIEGHGHWQDGTSTATIEVQVRRVKDLVVITFTDGSVLRHYLPQVEISSRIAGVPVRLTFTDGTMLTVPDGPLALELGRGKSVWVSLLEGNILRLFLPLLLGAAGTVWVIVNYAIPPLAATIANQLPVSFANSLGDQAFTTITNEIELLDQDTDELQEWLQQLGTEVVIQSTGTPPDPAGFHYQFFLASGEKIGINAFALPNGHIVISKKLIDLLTEDETFAVLAHEVGHVEKRHALQSLVRLSAWYVIGSLLFNDYSFFVFPVLLAEMSYSRDHESEVDCYAANVLATSGRNPDNIISSLGKIEAGHKQEAEETKENPDLHGVPGRDPLNAKEADDTNEAEETAKEEDIGTKLIQILASHPQGEDRAARIRECTNLSAPT